MPYFEYTEFEEEATSGIATCQICRQPIEKNTSRLGYISQYRNWVAIKWVHLLCASPKAIMSVIVTCKMLEQRMVAALDMR